MARFKPIHKGLKLLPVDFDRQVIPGSFEYALCHLVDRELDLSAFHARYKCGIRGRYPYFINSFIRILPRSPAWPVLQCLPCHLFKLADELV